jgi:pSer/pThr/pTyr-binding forkhead associated (FHA) protein
LHVTQLLGRGLPGRVFSTDRDVVSIGREGADLSFPHDRFMSGRHARIEIGHGGLLQVIDSGSLNGTFVRVQRLPHRLQTGDEILCGSMLFRVEIELSHPGPTP